jgi:hypothetical protein
MSEPKSVSPQAHSVDEWVAILAIGFFGYFVVAVVALQFLRADYDPLSHFISEYAVGPYGEIMSSAFISMSLGALFLFVGLVGWLKRGSRPKVVSRRRRKFRAGSFGFSE